MKDSTRNWVDKAEGNWNGLNQLMRVRNSPNYDLACFAAQQCAECYLKARLVEDGSSFPKTHDLTRLLDLLLPTEPAWDVLRPSLDTLIAYAVEYRYPGRTADRDEAKEARRLCAVVRHTVRPSLGLPV